MLPSPHSVPFPAKPSLEDRRRSEFLRLAGVPGLAGLYILGCFARYVTIYAQQVRALNLIDSLAKSGLLSARTRLAVIGAGIGGVTAAAAAQVRGVRDILLFEKEDDILTLQRTSHQRHVHPHIYDWPAADAFDNEAKLPVLAWTAGSAADVVQGMREEWALNYRSGVTVRPNETVTDIRRNGAQFAIITSRGSERADIVIIAAGFGLDSQAISDGYWTDSRIDGREASNERGTWLVSGVGDGALTDLMRLSIEHFRHREVLDAFDVRARERVGAVLLDAEKQRLPAHELIAVYRKAAAEIARESSAGGTPLRDRLNPRRFEKVWVNSSEAALFSPRASVLNRLITAWLLEERRFELLPQPGDIDRTERTGQDRIVVHFTDPAIAPLEVSHAILRHGPRPETRLANAFPTIYSACTDLEAEWKSASQHEDWTKDPLYGTDDFAPGRMPPLRVDFGDDVGCIAIGRNQELSGVPLEQRVQSVANRLVERATPRLGREVDPTPVFFPVRDVYANAVSWERTVRALCHSPVAIFDITGFEPSVMILLGIRAAVRRGVTVTVSEGQPASWNLPFNVAALNPVPLEAGSVKKMEKAVLAGWDALKSQPDAYLDLPVYDALRKLGEDHGRLDAREQILLLRWFEECYTGPVRDLVDERLERTFGSKRIVTTLDSDSPQLVQQRLYAAIRRTHLCVCDWTGWRPNVFFELGVRLAVSETDPICIRCEQKPPGWDNAVAKKHEMAPNAPIARWPDAPAAGEAETLDAFFRPALFTFPDSAELQRRLQEFKEEQQTKTHGGTLSPGRTYHVVKDFVDRRGEPGGMPVSRMLVSAARALAGGFVADQGNSTPVLFSETIGEQARRSAVEHLLASWYYLEGRYGLLATRGVGALAEDEQALLAELEDVRKSLDTLLEKIGPTGYDDVREDIARRMEKRAVASEETRG